MSNQYDLSDREIEILELLASGASNKEIAARLVISTNTVKVHLRNIYAKLDVKSRTEAAMSAIRNNLVGVEGIPSNRADTLPSNSADRPLTTQGLRDWSRNKRNIWVLTVSLTVMFLVMIIGMLLILRGGSRVDPENPELERWQRKADLPTPRSGLATVVYANQIYTIGGETSTGVTGVMQRYDPALDEWSILETKPLPVTDIKAAVIGERIYVPGGRLETKDPTDVVEVYDPLLSKWDRISSLPIKLSGYALVAFEGKLFLFGGWDGTSYLSTVFSYDPEEDQWVERAPMLTPRSYSGAAVVGGVIYVVGGYNQGVSLAVNESYYPSRDIEGGEPWIEKAPMPERRYAMGIDGLADILYVFGGKLDTNGTNNLLQYIPQRDEWQIIKSAPNKEERQQLGLITFEGNLYVMGGQTNGKFLSSNFAYQALYSLLIPILSK